MIQSAFKSAYLQGESSKNTKIGNIWGGVKDAATLATGVAGFTGVLGSGIVAKSAEYALAGKVGGIGGAIMLSTINEKKQSAQEQKMFTEEEVNQTIQSNLGDNPINRSAKKQLSTVFEKLTKAKESGIINKKGNIESSMGDIDPNSELGKKILGGMKDGNDR